MQTHKQNNLKANPKPTSKSRLAIIDQLRGLAFVLMAIFHFCYDLSYFQIVSIPMFSHPFWIGFRLVIVFLFLTMVGVSLTLNYKRGFNQNRYAKHFAKVAGAALLVTISTWLTQPQYFVFFGILHMIAISILLALPLLLLPKAYHKFYAIIGIALWVLGMFYRLNFPLPLVWLWASQTVPPTVDYVPLIPWFGFVMIGLRWGYLIEHFERYAMRQKFIKIPLEWCGRNALVLYLVHQPILWAGFLCYFLLLK